MHIGQGEKLYAVAIKALLRQERNVLKLIKDVIILIDLLKMKYFTIALIFTIGQVEAV